MSEHLCPNCKEKALTWYIDDDDRTWWRCSLCEFHIEEDESKETECKRCKLPIPTVSFLMTEKDKYFFCMFCANRVDKN